MNTHSERRDVVVVGAGFAGLYQLHRLRGIGLDTVCFEAGADVGGTWFWNRYPGARCDNESRFYSYSFSPELDQEWTWDETYGAQPQILAYLQHVADRFDLRRHIRLETRVVSAAYDEVDASWLVTLSTGESVRARFLVMATGCLSIPKVPDVPGIENFDGQVVATSNWPHDPVSFDGLRVAVIGTGSSGIQAIPLIAAEARELTVFQRTPNFAIPARNRALTPDEISQLKEGYRDLREQQAASWNGTPLEFPTQSVFDVSPAERERTYSNAWGQGSLVKMMTSYTDTYTDVAANDVAAEFIRDRIRETVTDPQVAAKLCPTTYPFGAKRPCLDTEYYATYNRDNVTLVDLRETPIETVTANGVRTAEHAYGFDMIVLATGFDGVTGALQAVDLRGRRGVSIQSRWADGPRSLLGLAISGFPNLFTVTGPFSPSILVNMVVAIEDHVDWITRCIEYMDANHINEIEATIKAEDNWVEHVSKIAEGSLFMLADSWWLGANVPGKPRVFLAYINGLPAYREACEGVADKGYDGFALRRTDVLGGV